MRPQGDGDAALARQVEEVEAAVAVYGQNAVSSDLISGELSLVVTVAPGVRLHATLVRDYPAASPLRARVDSPEASRAVHALLEAAVGEAVAAAPGQETVLLAAEALREAAEAHLAARGDTAEVLELAAVGPSALRRVAIWFHHIKATSKRKLIVAWARDLRLRGWSKPGFPGCVVAEGQPDDVEHFVKNLRSLTWQAMAVRVDETDAGSEPEPRLPEFGELPENGLSTIAAGCRGGLEHLVAALLKLNRAT